MRLNQPPEADQFPLDWMPAPTGTPQEIDEYLEHLAHVWPEEVKCTSPNR